MRDRDGDGGWRRCDDGRWAVAVAVGSGIGIGGDGQWPVVSWSVASGVMARGWHMTHDTWHMAYGIWHVARRVARGTARPLS
jgi:hypothetical protein